MSTLNFTSVPSVDQSPDHAIRRGDLAAASPPDVASHAAINAVAELPREDVAETLERLTRSRVPGRQARDRRDPNDPRAVMLRTHKAHLHAADRTAATVAVG